MPGAIKRDFDLVSGSLGHLQCGAVPRLHGIYAGCWKDSEVWAMTMQDGDGEVEVEKLLFHQK